MSDTKRWVYGPVLSRRFGRSLGVDLVPAKLCTFHCVYCQVGLTTRCALERRSWVEPPVVIGAVEEAVGRRADFEVVTLAGSGEPTLYASLGELIEGLRDAAQKPVVLLTNGSLLFRDDVAADAVRADVLAPSLDAGDEETFRRINHPHPDLSFDKVWKGIRDVTNRLDGTVRMEVMLVSGVNDSRESLEKIAEKLETMRIDTIDINTPVRPVASGRAIICSAETLELARRIFGPKARVIPPPEMLSGGERASSIDESVERIAETLKRRPCTAAELAGALNLAGAEVSKALAVLARRGILEERGSERDPYYFVDGDPPC